MGGSGMMKMGSAELLDTMATVSAAPEARYGDVPEETLITFIFCCQCLHAVFALFTLKHDHNKALGATARGEAALPLSQGQAAVHRHHRLQVQHGGGQVTGKKTELL